MLSLSGIVIPAVGLLAMPAVAMADGLPQLDFGNKLTTYQVVWGALIFVILYVLASRTALPKVEAVLEERARRIETYLPTKRHKLGGCGRSASYRPVATLPP